MGPSGPSRRAGGGDPPRSGRGGRSRVRSDRGSASSPTARLVRVGRSRRRGACSGPPDTARRSAHDEAGPARPRRCALTLSRLTSDVAGRPVADLFPDWPQYATRLRDAVTGSNAEELAIRAGPKHGLIWRSRPTAGTRVYWLWRSRCRVDAVHRAPDRHRLGGRRDASAIRRGGPRASTRPGRSSGIASKGTVDDLAEEAVRTRETSGQVHRAASVLNRCSPTTRSTPVRSRSPRVSTAWTPIDLWAAAGMTPPKVDPGARRRLRRVVRDDAHLTGEQRARQRPGSRRVAVAAAGASAFSPGGWGSGCRRRVSRPSGCPRVPRGGRQGASVG